MSLRSSTGHLQISNTASLSTARPASTTSWAYWCIAKFNSDLANVGLLLDGSFDGGSEAFVTYFDGGDNIAYNANIVGGGANDVQAFASRPSTGEWILWFIDQDSSGGTQRAAWYNLTTPAGWVQAPNVVGLTTAQATDFFNQSLTSNSNPCDADVALWRCAEAPRTLAEYLQDANSESPIYADVFSFLLVDDVTWTEQTGNGATAVTQGGTLTTGDPYTFPAGDRGFKRNSLRPRPFAPGLAR